MLGTTIILAAAATLPQPEQPRDQSPGRAASASVSAPCRRGEWLLQETSNFRVWSQLPASEHQALAESCEALRSESQASWFGDAPAGSWEPKCQVVVHPTVQGYNRALGSLNGRSVGCTTLKIDGGRIVYRRIDLRADAPDWQSSALPHELTHVVVAGHLDRGCLAPWADEGMAALAEPVAKQALRVAALGQARSSGRVYGIRELLSLTQPPRPEYRNAFYGQSVSLVRFLVEYASRKQFVEFLEVSAVRGQEPALAEVFGIRDADELEQLWLAWLRSPRAAVAVTTAGAD